MLIGRGFFTAGAALWTSDVLPATLESLVSEIPSSTATFFVYGEKGQPEEKPANELFYRNAAGLQGDLEGPGLRPYEGHRSAAGQEYERRVVGFFDKTLLGKGARR